MNIRQEEAAINAFAEAIKLKLALGRAKGRSGWEHCPVPMLWQLLRDHVEKGDPIDCGLFAMMIERNLRATGQPVGNVALHHRRPYWDELSREQKLQECMIDMLANLAAAVSAYETFAGNSERRSVRDALFNTRQADYHKALARGRAAYAELFP